MLWLGHSKATCSSPCKLELHVGTKTTSMLSEAEALKENTIAMHSGKSTFNKGYHNSAYSFNPCWSRANSTLTIISLNMFAMERHSRHFNEDLLLHPWQYHY